MNEREVNTIWDGAVRHQGTLSPALAQGLPDGCQGCRGRLERISTAPELLAEGPVGADIQTAFCSPCLGGSQQVAFCYLTMRADGQAVAL